MLVYVVRQWEVHRELCVLCQVQTDVSGGSQSQSTLAPVGAATSDHARPVGPKHDRSPEQMQVHNTCTCTYCTYTHNGVEFSIFW